MKQSIETEIANLLDIDTFLPNATVVISRWRQRPVPCGLIRKWAEGRVSRSRVEVGEVIRRGIHACRLYEYNDPKPIKIKFFNWQVLKIIYTTKNDKNIKIS